MRKIVEFDGILFCEIAMMIFETKFVLELREEHKGRGKGGGPV